MDRKLKQQIPITIQAPQTHQSIYKEKTQNSLEPIGPNDPLTKIVAIVQITYKPS